MTWDSSIQFDPVGDLSTRQNRLGVKITGYRHFRNTLIYFLFLQKLIEKTGYDQKQLTFLSEGSRSFKPLFQTERNFC